MALSSACMLGSFIRTFEVPALLARARLSFKNAHQAPSLLSARVSKNRAAILNIRVVRRPAVSAAQETSTTQEMAPIQLYSFPTPNGQKIGIALEELGIPYEAHVVHIGKGDQFKPEFLKISPNNKIPAIHDPEGPNGPLSLFESGAILLYLAEKYGKLLPTDPALKWQAVQWVFFQAGGVGPIMGQLNHFKGVPKDKMADNSYPIDRFLTETKRLMKVLDGQLAGKEYIVGEYSIADIMLGPWVNGCRTRMADEFPSSEYPNIYAWLDKFYARPAVQKGVTVCSPS
eukprot:TRINITY_DN16_c0_g1_i1.p1 TRINITY_DN16_c0_g1~~TRINITY_DN16_c0_g1_i1.p1  ORF type:complete len:296 (-),score=46.42 TRINITY_DN16_c0_g1_i1:636-1496(-)